jgi:ribonuclease BN (tRNA processing enzyme)
MKLRILGCSGGISGNHRTTSMLVDDDILIDAGTGVGDLSLDELARIDHVFITHAHLDHIACLPFILDTVGEMRHKPLTMYATKATQEAIQSHIFNWVIWPDFSQIPNVEQPYLRFQTIELAENIHLGERTITALPANHTVQAVGYHLDSGKASLVFTGDTTTHDALWNEVNKIPNLRYLIIETAFSDHARPLAILSKHLCPSLLGEELVKLQSQADIFITHIKPGQSQLIMHEIEKNIGQYKLQMLQNNQLFEF